MSSSTQGRDRVTLAEMLALRFVAPRIKTTARARAGRAGVHLSSAHARGMDYAESRAYQPGDDIRAMDWRLTARIGKPHTKLFREERERSLVVVMDTNRSMRFGTHARFKSVQAARAAALAAWSAVRCGDRVGALAFGAAREALPPNGGRRGALALLGALERWGGEPEAGDESLAAGLRRCSRLAPAGARVLLVSDGFSVDAEARPLLLRLARRTEVLVLIVADAMELAAPAASRLSVEHAGRRFSLDLADRRARVAFAEQLGRGRRQLESLARDCALATATIDTAAPVLAAVETLFARTGVRR